MMLKGIGKMRGRTFLTTVIFCGLFATPSVAQNWTMWEGPQDGPRLRVQLRDKEQNARNHLAAIEVEVQNVWLHYPDPIPQPGVQAAVLQYRLDSCPPVLTTATRIRFDQLAPGDHTVVVTLLGPDNRPISPSASLQVKVP
jgi:hypothetical protein